MNVNETPLLHFVPRTYVCGHPKFQNRVVFDFEDLWTGAPDYKSGKGKKSWLGGFSGRPLLAEEILRGIQDYLAVARPEVMRTGQTVLRQFWRFLDGFEKLGAPARVNSVADLNDLHGVAWLSPTQSDAWSRPPNGTYTCMLNWIQRARHRRGIRPLTWSPAPNAQKIQRQDTPTRAAGIRLIHVLTKHVHATYRRWALADQLASTGRNLLAMAPKERSRRQKNDAQACADAHATYRALISLTGDPIPCVVALNRAAGRRKPDRRLPHWWPCRESPNGETLPISISELQGGLYPTSSDLYLFLCLFMARCGWNQTTTYALDCSDPHKWSSECSDDLMWLHSFKSRSNHWQDTVSPKSHPTHCFQIIGRLLERNRPLRDLVLKNESRCNYPDVAVTSPWLGINRSGRHRSQVQVLESYSNSRANTYLSVLINLNNASATRPQQTIPPFRISDLRDVYAEAVYRDNGYSAFVTQFALGQRDPSSIRHYLRIRAWRQESEKTVHDLVTALFNQIQVHKKIDLTLLRATMDGISVTEDQVNRLETFRANRTYSGLGCINPQEPPEWIDPSNPRDGTKTCVQQMRCPVCVNGKVFSDSLDALTKCLAELEHRRLHCGDLKWRASSDAADIEVYLATLEQWPKAEVLARLSSWRDRIQSGAHKVVQSTGGTHK